MSLFHLKDWIWIGRLRAEAMRDWTIVVMVQMTCWRFECSWLSLTNYKVLAPSESLHTRTSGRLTFSADLLHDCLCTCILYTYACIHTNTHMHGMCTYTYHILYWHCMCYCILRCRTNFGVFILAKHLYTTQLASLNQLPTGSLKQQCAQKLTFQLIVQCFGPNLERNTAMLVLWGRRIDLASEISSLLVGPFSKIQETTSIKTMSALLIGLECTGCTQSSYFISAFAS